MTMKGFLRRTLQWAIMAFMLVGLPLAGIELAGLDAGAYLQFPPLTRHFRQAPFSWSVFILFAALDLLLIMGLGFLFSQTRSNPGSPPTSGRRWPAWGWLGLLVLAAGWMLAWTRWKWFAPWQVHTFCLPWIGYILLVNAWCLKRSGRSLLTDAPCRFLLLIPGSALFWWFFEYLNRFVQNWYYTGVANLSAQAYILFSSLAFATVLPAVLSTYRLLLSFPRLANLPRLRPLSFPRYRIAAALSFAAAALGLIYLGVLPHLLFALLWVSPLLIITALQVLGGEPTIFSPLGRGDWRPIAGAALSALICGFFWELWNVGSLARWHYAVPYVDRFHIFAMPVLGYGGYLPFGLECLMAGLMVMGGRPLDLE